MRQLITLCIHYHFELSLLPSLESCILVLPYSLSFSHYQISSHSRRFWAFKSHHRCCDVVLWCRRCVVYSVSLLSHGLVYKVSFTVHLLYIFFIKNYYNLNFISTLLWCWWIINLHLNMKCVSVCWLFEILSNILAWQNYVVVSTTIIIIHVEPYASNKLMSLYYNFCFYK